MRTRICKKARRERLKLMEVLGFDGAILDAVFERHAEVDLRGDAERQDLVARDARLLEQLAVAFDDGLPDDGVEQQIELPDVLHLRDGIHQHLQHVLRPIAQNGPQIVLRHARERVGEIPREVAGEAQEERLQAHVPQPAVHRHGLEHRRGLQLVDLVQQRRVVDRREAREAHLVQNHARSSWQGIQRSVGANEFQ